MTPTKLTGSLRTNLLAWTPLISLILIAVFSYPIMTSVITCDTKRDIGLRCTPHEPNVKSRILLNNSAVSKRFSELRSRLTWSVSTLFFAFAFTATGLLILTTALTSFRELKPRVVTVIVTIVGSLLIIWLIEWAVGWGHDFDFSGHFLDSSVYLVAPATELFVSGAAALAPVALVGLALSASLIFLRIDPIICSQSAVESAKALADAMRRIRVLLYTGALALVAGTFQAAALYTWALSLLQIDGYSAGSEIPLTIGTILGSFYSILLAGIFVPALVRLRQHARFLVEKEKPGSLAVEKAKWLEEHEISVTVPRQLISAIAVVAPLLAGGPIVALLELIGG